MLNKKYVFLVCVVCILVWLTSAYFSEEKSILPEGQRRSSTPSIKVITSDIVFTKNTIRFEAVGTGRAKNSVEIFPAVAEEVTAVHFKAGEKVEKGYVLVQLDDRAEQLALDLAKVKLKEARNLLGRYDKAVKEGAVPESEVDAARAAVDAAEVEQKKAELAIQFRKVIAPFSGVVGISRVDPGERITTSTMITGLDNRELLLVDFEVPEALAGSLKEGQKISGSTPAFPGRTFVGTISALESRVDNSSRTIRTRAEIDNSDDTLRPGMSFSLVLEIPGGDFATVPEISVQWGSEGSFIWAVRNGKAARVPVKIVARTAGKVRVDGDISPGEQVIVEGLQRLKEGREVTPLGSIENPARQKRQAENGGK